MQNDILVEMHFECAIYFSYFSKPFKHCVDSNHMLRKFAKVHSCEFALIMQTLVFGSGPLKQD